MHLEETVSAGIQEHTTQGEDIEPWLVWLLVVAVLVAAVTVMAGATWTIVQIGESGSRAVWEGSFSDDPLDR